MRAETFPFVEIGSFLLRGLEPDTSVVIESSKIDEIQEEISWGMSIILRFGGACSGKEWIILLVSDNLSSEKSLESESAILFFPPFMCSEYIENSF